MKRKLIYVLIAVLSVVGLALPIAPAMAQATWEPVYTTQTHLPGSAIGQFVDPLPVLSAAGGGMETVIAGESQIVLNMTEFKAQVLPSTFVPADAVNYDGTTWVWGYRAGVVPTTNPAATYIGPVIVATRNVPTQVKFVNNLGTTDTTNLLAYKYSTDQSLHWANPNMVDRYVANPFIPPDPAWLGTVDHYSGAIPAAVHLHGGEDAAATDGGPESWFTSDGMLGKAFYSEGWDGSTPQNYCIYTYPNVQEAAPLWFHDHTLGATRLNVYMGLAGAYDLIDPNLNLPSGLTALGLDRDNDGNTAGDEFLIPLVVQDRSFDTNGQLFFTASGPSDPVNPSLNPRHPYWSPEFFGDTVAVNGKVWPYLDVQAQRYRFYMIGGANARTWELSFHGNFTDTSTVPTVWQIATDQGYLDQPVQVDPLVIMPGERADFIIDFAGFSGNYTLHNLGPDEPFSGIVADQAIADPATTGKVMEFRVSAATGADTSFDPAASGATIRTNGQQIVRLVDPVAGSLAAGVTPDLTRELALVEIANDNPTTVNGVTYQGGPLEVLVNNSKWAGLRPDETNPNLMTAPPLTPINNSTADGLGNWLTELPKEGATEVWEIVNTTMDAHPIHTHLAQFQLMNRQGVNMGDFAVPGTAYIDTYKAAFPGGTFIPAYGPPLAYTPSTASGGKYGGNPDVTPFVAGYPIQPPNPNEAGWKDTVLCPPGMVTRFVVRWAPQDVAVDAPASDLHYPFIPNGPSQGTAGAMYDYVWHCHIVDHEDNEMMRPDAVYAAPEVNAGGNAAISNGVTFTRTGSFRASGAAPWTATVNYGDGSGDLTLAQNPSLTEIGFALSHKFPDGSGIYTVTVTVTDGTGASGSDSFMVTVTKSDVNPKTIKLNDNKSVFKVTIYGSSSFNVSLIDQSTLKFGPTAFSSPYSTPPTKVNIADSNADGVPDLLAFFTRPDSLTPSTTSASIWGTISGLDFVGTQSVKVLSK
jgi:FtsP/CotA-like multicopper oxidase with cupredoxin domain